MTGLSRKKGGRDGLIIPHLSYQDHIRIFTQSTSQRIRKASHIFTHFSLVNQRFLTLIFVLDRIFDRNNMPVAVLIHMFDHRRKCRGLSASGRPGHKNQSSRLLCHLVKPGWHPQLFQRGNLRIQQADGRRHLMLLPENIDPLTAAVTDLQPKVHISSGSEDFFLSLVHTSH